MNGRRAGFTLIELITVTIIIGLLASIAAMKYVDLTRDAITSKIASDFNTIKLAAYTYEADHNNQWPAEVGPGITPPELMPYLPGGLTFAEPNYTLDWENLISSGGAGAFQLGITCTTSDSRLATKLVQRLGSTAPYFVVGNTITYVIIDPSGNY